MNMPSRVWLVINDRDLVWGIDGWCNPNDEKVWVYESEQEAVEVAKSLKADNPKVVVFNKRGLA